MQEVRQQNDKLIKKRDTFGNLFKPISSLLQKEFN